MLSGVIVLQANSWLLQHKYDLKCTDIKIKGKPGKV